MMVGQKHTVFIADTTVNERPTASELADIAEQTATVARAMGQEPRVAFLSYANFGNPPGKWLDTIRDAVRLLDMRGDGCAYEGEMTPDVDLNRDMNRPSPVSRQSVPANVLVIAGLHYAHITAKLLKELEIGQAPRGDIA